MNDYYNPSGAITPYTLADARSVAAEFAGVQAGFDKLPSIQDLRDAVAVSNFYATLAEAIAAVPVGGYFTCAETGQLRVYQRISTPPYYADLGDAAAPISKSWVINHTSISVFDYFSENQISDVKANTAYLDVSAQLAECFADAEALGAEVVWPAGTYRYATSPNWAWQHCRHRAIGDVRLRYVGTGRAVIFDAGGATSDLIYDCNAIGRFIVEGNALGSDGVYTRGVHHSRFEYIVRGCGTASSGLLAQFGVCNTYAIKVTPNQDGWFGGARPANGITLNIRNAGEFVSYCDFDDWLSESPSGIGVQLLGTLGNNFWGGTAEACGTYGVFGNAGSHQDKFWGTDFEGNVTADAYLTNANDVFLLYCDTTNLVAFGTGAKSCGVIGGVHKSILLDLGSIRCRAHDLVYDRFGTGGTFVNAGTNSDIDAVYNSDGIPWGFGTIYAHRGKIDGLADATATIKTAAASSDSINLPDGTFVITDNIPLNIPKRFTGNGAKTAFSCGGAFPAKPVFTISPAAGADPKGWQIGGFGITPAGSATSVFKIDLDAAGKYTSKLGLRNVRSNAAVSSGKFVELTNVLPNADGLFTVVFEDNWSFGGYHLDNVGDSVVLNRNTTTGAGVGYYINQLGEAANISIRDGNCTCTGGALRVVKGSNVLFEAMQVECPAAFTGTDNALVAVKHATDLVFNTKILHSSINTQGNALYCIYLQNCDQTLIDGCNLYCDPATGAHIYIDSGARNTIIGNNKYFNALTGAEIDPIIVNNGIGTVGVWVDLTISLAGWTSQNTANEHPLGIFLDRDGNVQLRGRVAGPAATAGDTLCTIPAGYRAKVKAYLLHRYGAAGASSNVVLQAISSGALQILTTGATSIYMCGAVFSIR